MVSTLTGPIVGGLGTESIIATALGRSIAPFTAAAEGYDTVELRWTAPLAAAGTGFRITRSRSGFPRTYDDGQSVTIVESPTWNETAGYTVTDLPGGWHYFSFFIKRAGAWLRVSTVDVLIPFDYESSEAMWGLIPAHYKYLNYNTSPSINLRINPVEGEQSPPNLLLWSFISVFGWGMDMLRTQAESVLTGYDVDTMHVSRLATVAKQFGHELEQAVPTHSSRTMVRNLASLYRKRGTVEGINDIAAVTTGWDVDVSIGPNLMLSEEQAAFVNPQYPEWDPDKQYLTGNRVRYGSWLFEAVTTSRGSAQSPPASSTNNTWWNVVSAVSDRSLVRADTGDIGDWQFLLDGTPTSGRTAIAVGVQDPTDTGNYQANALEVQRVDSAGMDYILVSARPHVGAPGYNLTTKRQVLESAIPLPQPVAWTADRTFTPGALTVDETGVIYEALLTTQAPVTDTFAWKQVSNAGQPPRYILSMYAHGPFTGSAGTGGRTVTPWVWQYNSFGDLISEISGGALTSGNVGEAWTRPYYLFTPHVDARYVVVGAHINDPVLNIKQYLTKWMLERPQIAATTPSTYSKAREIRTVVKADRINTHPNPGVEGATLSAFSAANGATITRQAASAISGGFGLRVSCPASGVTDSGVNITASLAVTVGSLWTLSVEVRAVTAGDYNLSIQGPGGSVPDNRATITLAAGQVGRITRTWSPTATGSVSAYVLRSSANANTITDFDVDNIVLERSEAFNGYFDGSMGDDYLWEGAVNNSRSYYYESRVDRSDAMIRAIKDAVPMGVGLRDPQFAVWTG